MKKIFLFAALVLVLQQAQAQIKVHAGINTAINSTFVLDQGLKADPRYLSTATYKWAPIGVSFGVDFGKKFGLQIESIKSAMGQLYQVRDAYNQVVGQRKFDMEYIQIPLMMKLMSGGSGLARFNFQMGPQLSIIQTGTEILSYVESTQNIPDGVPPPIGAGPQNPDGSYDVPAYDEIVTGTDDIQGALYSFQNREIQLAVAMGVDLDITRLVYLSVNAKANYSFTDMRGQDLLDILKQGNVSELFDQRANLAVGIQLGVHFMFGGTRRFNAMDEKLRNEMKGEF
jgi:hypothetical protein